MKVESDEDGFEKNAHRAVVRLAVSEKGSSGGCRPPGRKEKSFLRRKLLVKPVNENDLRRPRSGNPGVDHVRWVSSA